MSTFKSIKLENIVADENQPRKNFNASKMASLVASIKKHGIKSPLIVEDMGNGKYLLEDGERRYRAAQVLKIKEVPAIVEPLSNATERTVRQFNIQEQHEAWSPIEKAVAINRVAKELGITLAATLELLSVGKGDANRYAAFSQLAAPEAYLKQEIPLDYAAVIVSLRNAVKNLYINELEKEFTRQDEQRLEKRIIHGIKEGTIQKRGDVVRLKDSFTKNPKLVEKFLGNEKITPDSLFLESKAKGAYHLRNAVNMSHYFVFHAKEFLKLRDVKVSENQQYKFQQTLKLAKELIDLS